MVAMYFDIPYRTVLCPPSVTVPEHIERQSAMVLSRSEKGF